jgi:hypothetical protein
MYPHNPYHFKYLKFIGKINLPCWGELVSLFGLLPGINVIQAKVGKKEGKPVISKMVRMPKT